MKKVSIALLILSFLWNGCALLHRENPRYNNLKKIPLTSYNKPLDSSTYHLTIHKINDTISSVATFVAYDTSQHIPEINNEKQIKKVYALAKHVKPLNKSLKFPNTQVIAKAPVAEQGPPDDIIKLLIYILIIALILAIISLFLPDFIEILIAVFLIVLLILLLLYLAGNLNL